MYTYKHTKYVYEYMIKILYVSFHIIMYNEIRDFFVNNKQFYINCVWLLQLNFNIPKWTDKFY